MAGLPIGPRTKRILKIVGYIALALVTFVFALQLTFPYNRVKDKLVEALSSKYDVTIASVERGIMPGTVYFNNVTLRTHTTKADEVASTFIVKRLEVKLGIFALIGGTASVDLDAEIGPGHIRGNIALSKTSTEIDIEGVDLPSGMMPMRDLMGLPMSGKIDFDVDLVLPNEKSKTGKVTQNWQKAKGAFAFSCPNNCVIGDGKTKLKPKLKNSRQQAFAADGIDFGKVSVVSLAAHAVIKDGVLELDKFETKSEDGELHVDFQVTLAPQMDESMVAGCLRFKGSDALLKKEPRTHAALSTTGANMGPDGLFHIRLDGKFKEMKRLAQTCGPATKGNMDDPSGGSHTKDKDPRPNLTVTPESKDTNEFKTPTPNTPQAINPPPPAADAGAASPPPGPVNEQNTNGHNAGSDNQGSASVVPTPPGEPLPPGEQPAQPAHENPEGSATH